MTALSTVLGDGAVTTAKLADGAVTAAKLAAGVGGGGGSSGVTGEVVLTDYGDTSAGGTALNAAMAALPAGGGIVRVPAGTWTLDETVEFAKSNVIIAGVGPGSTVFTFNGATVTTAFAMADTTQRSVFLRDFTILQNGVGNVGVAVDATKFERSEITNVIIGGSTGVGTAPLGGILAGGGTYYNLIQHCQIHVSGTGSYGIKFETSASSNTVHSVRILGGAAATGIVVNALAIKLDRVDIGTGLLVGIEIQSQGHDCAIIAADIEQNGTNLAVAAGVEALTVVGGIIVDGVTANIANSGGYGLTIIGCRVNLPGGGTYDPVHYRTDNAGLPPRRWLDPQLAGVGLTSLAFGQSPGTVATWSMLAVDVVETTYTDAMCYTVGTTSSGNVRAALWGPATANDSGTGLALVASSASTAQAAASTTQILTWSAGVLLRPGRYYLGIMADGTTGTYMGFATFTDTSGRNGYFTNSGAYTTPNDPSGTMTANGFRPPMLRLRCAAAATI